MSRTLHALLLFCLSLLMTTCSLTEKDCVTIQGNIKHLGRSELHISYFADTHLLAYDTVYSAESGKFEIKINGTNEITPITIYFQDFKCWTTVFAKAGDEIRVTGDIEMVDLLTISGGKVNEDLTRFKQDICTLYIERKEIIDGKYQNGGSSVEVRLAEINLALKRKAKQFIVDNPSSVASVVLIQDFFYQDYDPNTRELLDLLVGEAKNNYLTTRIREGMTAW